MLSTLDSHTATVERSPEDVDDNKDAVAEAVVVAALEPIQEAVQDRPKKASPVVELLNKRIKVQTKKLSRIAVYSSKSPSELNEDQKKSVASLPSIQGAVRELEETKKAVEIVEAEDAKERAKQREEEEKATSDRIAQAVSDVSLTHQQRLSEILSLLHLSSLLLASDPTTFTLTIDEKERHALCATAETLLGSECTQKEEALSGILFGHGDIDGITYDRLLEVVDAYRNPSLDREPTPTPEEPIPQEDTEPAIVEQVTSSVVATEPPPLASEGVAPTSSGGSFHFMQESELEGTSFEHGAEWVEKPQDPPESSVIVPDTELPAGLTVIDTGIPHDVNGIPKHVEEPPLSAVSAALDWAADDGDGLPSINSLHAKFGTSGAATPEALPQDADPVVQASERDATSIVNGDVTTHSNTQADEDGFVVAKNGRGRQSDARHDVRGGERGRGRGGPGFRGDRGGEYRGGMCILLNVMYCIG
ncbi:hypothetical protein JB92DRAFT_2798603 [Gautieria morchelliformis]|nr:hypothetical protein JB92DRAFT_2798603 [Gautieria morchelliformis]